MEPISLIAAYAIPIAFIAWLWLGDFAGWRGKLLVTLLLPVFYWLHWQGLQDYKGWPTQQALPEQFELLAADIVEPRKSGNKDGTIHLWIRMDTGTAPRVHELPYSRKLHETLHTARENAAQGRSQVGLLQDDDGTGRGADAGDGRRLEFRDQAVGMLPPKREK